MTRLTLTIEETAEALGVSRTSAYQAAKSGEIPAIRVGRRLLVPIVALDRLLQDVAAESPPTKGDLVEELDQR